MQITGFKPLKLVKPAFIRIPQDTVLWKYKLIRINIITVSIQLSVA